jgi:hypothetical protein
LKRFKDFHLKAGTRFLVLTFLYVPSLLTCEIFKGFQEAPLSGGGRGRAVEQQHRTLRSELHLITPCTSKVDSRPRKTPKVLGSGAIARLCGGGRGRAVEQQHRTLQRIIRD